MYQLDAPHRRRSRRLRLLAIVGVVVLFVGFMAWLINYLKPDTTIEQSDAFTAEVIAEQSATKTVTGATFQLTIPDSWQQKTENATYTWRGTKKDDVARKLDVYVDQLPPNFAVNRLLVVKSDGAKLLPDATVSDNCTRFTDEKTTNPETGIAPSKWSEVSFLCDMANYSRNVVGASSGEALNTVSATGEKGKHRYFFVYTDHSSQPNHDIFIDMLRSFQAL